MNSSQSAHQRLSRAQTAIIQQDNYEDEPDSYSIIPRLTKGRALTRIPLTQAQLECLESQGIKKSVTHPANEMLKAACSISQKHSA